MILAYIGYIILHLLYQHLYFFWHLLNLSFSFHLLHLFHMFYIFPFVAFVPG